LRRAPSFLSSVIRRRPPPTPFPYTPLFRSRHHGRTSRAASLARIARDVLRSRELFQGGGKSCLDPSRFSPDSGRIFRSKPCARRDRKSTRLNSSHVKISYAVFRLKKKIHPC